VIEINFLPDSDRKDRYPQVEQGIIEYEKIWKEDGERIVKTIENLSSLRFKENYINVVVL